MDASDIANLTKDELISMVSAISVKHPEVLCNAKHKIAFNAVIRQINKITLRSFPSYAFDALENRMKLALEDAKRDVMIEKSIKPLIDEIKSEFQSQELLIAELKSQLAKKDELIKQLKSTIVELRPEIYGQVTRYVLVNDCYCSYNKSIIPYLRHNIYH